MIFKSFLESGGDINTVASNHTKVTPNTHRASSKRWIDARRQIMGESEITGFYSSRVSQIQDINYQTKKIERVQKCRLISGFHHHQEKT
jgi:hypothetical protein